MQRYAWMCVVNAGLLMPGALTATGATVSVQVDGPGRVWFDNVRLELVP
jgi:hypothetical protein